MIVSVADMRADTVVADIGVQLGTKSMPVSGILPFVMMNLAEMVLGPHLMADGRLGFRRHRNAKVVLFFVSL